VLTSAHGNDLGKLGVDRGARPMLEIVLPEKGDAVIGLRADPSTP